MKTLNHCLNTESITPQSRPVFLKYIHDSHRQLRDKRLMSRLLAPIGSHPWELTANFLKECGDKRELAFRHFNWLCDLGQRGVMTPEEFVEYERAMCVCGELLSKDTLNDKDPDLFLKHASILKPLPANWTEVFMVAWDPDKSLVHANSQVFTWEEGSKISGLCRLDIQELRNCFRFRGKTASLPQMGIELDSHRTIRERMDELYRVKQLYPDGIAGVNLRPLPLIVAPSGLGKTHSVKAWAQKAGLPLLSLQSGSWNVTGARYGNFTQLHIQQFLRACDGKGVLFFDELDKFSCHDTDWHRSVLQELYVILDGRTDSLPGWTNSDAHILNRAYIVGAGTWQADFNHGWGKISSREILESQTAIPQELLYRFNERIILLEELSTTDFRRFLEYFHRTVLKEQPLQKELDKLCEDAVASRRNFRWIEAFIGEHATKMLMVKDHAIPTSLKEMEQSR